MQCDNMHFLLPLCMFQAIGWLFIPISCCPLVIGSPEMVHLGLLCEYELLCSLSCTLDLIFSIPVLFRWSGGAVRSSPVAQGLQHRLCRLRERRDSRRGGTTSGGGRLKQSQNITLFCQIVWHHRSSQHHVYCCNYFSIFCMLFFAFYIGKITLF